MRPPRPPATLWTIVLLAAALTLSGCIGDETTLTPPEEDPDSASRAPPEAWASNLSEPTYDRIDSRVVDIPASDGTRLSLTLHLPEALPDDELVPTLLTITPYQPLNAPHTDDSPLTETSEPPQGYAKYVEHGAAVVIADARGTGGSEGCLDYGGPQDRSDARTFVDWIRSQAWSNGRIATDGVSHPGMGSLVAHVATNLTGALAHAPVVSYYQDEWYNGAKFEDQLNVAYTAIETVPPLYTEPDALAAQQDTCHADTALEFGPIEGPYTDEWAKRDLARYVDGNATEPLLLTQGFVDTAVHPDHAQRYWNHLPDDAPTWLVLGWWGHGHPDMEGSGIEDFEQIRHRWIDHLLFERPNGALDEPRVLVEDDTGTWHESDDWPLDPSRTIPYNASPDGTLTTAPADEGSVSYQDEPGATRGDWGPAKALFTTDPLDEDRLVNGAPTVHLEASSSEDATKWVLYLVEIHDDGDLQRITHGYADSHTHGEEGTWETMTPGEPYDWTVELMPTAVIVEEGHRIGLLVASQDSRAANLLPAGDDAGPSACWSYPQQPCYDPSGIVPASTAGQAQNTIHTGPNATSITLSWTDPDATDKPPWS